MNSIGSSLSSICPSEVASANSSKDDVAFERAVAQIVNNIELDIRCHGDDDENPLDLKNVEFQIQTDRILKLLDVAIEKIKMALCLPIISEQWPTTDFNENQIEVLGIYDKLGKNGKWDRPALLSCINKAERIYKELVPDLIQKVLHLSMHAIFTSFIITICLHRSKNNNRQPKSSWI